MPRQSKNTNRSTSVEKERPGRRVPLQFVGRHLGKDWAERHRQAVRAPQGPEIGIISVLKGWEAYAASHEARFQSRIGEDHFLGPQWAKIGAAARQLLNGELGRLDGGSLDHFICRNLEVEGFDPEDL